MIVFHPTLQRALLSLCALTLLLTELAHAYLSYSCRSCIASGDWAACSACYNSKSGIVPFYGLRKRSPHYDYGFLPGDPLERDRGDQYFYGQFKRSSHHQPSNFLPGDYGDYRGDYIKRSSGAGFLPGGYDRYPGFLPEDYKYGLNKRSPVSESGYYGFLPGGNPYGDYRGASYFRNVYKRSSRDGDNNALMLAASRDENKDGGDLVLSELRERSGYLATYCCVTLQDDDCCDALGLTSEDDSSDSLQGETYYLVEEDKCELCTMRDTFDYAICLQCVNKRK